MTEDLYALTEQLREARAREAEARAQLAVAVRAAHAEGVSGKAIVKITGLAPETVKRWLERR